MRQNIRYQQTGPGDVMIRPLTFSDLELPVDKSLKMAWDQADKGNWIQSRHREACGERQPLEMQSRGKLSSILRI